MNLLVTMSGGTSSVINSTLVGIIKQARQSKYINKIIAGFPGIIGALDNSFVDLGLLNNNELGRLSRTPGSSIIGTTRVSILSLDDLEVMRSIFNENNIGAFINIGGNGTIKQTRLISQYVGNNLQVAAAPKTVDNDLGDYACKDVLFTPGFPSCVNHWLKIMQLLNIESLGGCSHDKVIVAQTFGRDTGFIAGSVRVIDPYRELPLLILLPEDPQSLDKIFSAVDELVLKHGRAIIVMSEGYPIGDVGEIKDVTGQTMYGACNTTAAQLLTDYLNMMGIQSRSYIPTVLQRQDMQNTLNFDRDIAECQGRDIVKRMDEGESSFLSSVSEPSSDKSPGESNTIISIPFDSFNNYSRHMNSKFIEKGSFDVSNNYLEYLNSFFKVSRFEQNYSALQNDFLIPNEVSPYEKD